MVSLEGTLDLFALPDVLRLLGGTGTTGVLQLDDGGRAGQVWLDGGRITWAAAGPGPRQLVARLRHQAGIDPAALAAALEAGGPGLTAALVSAGAATRSALAAPLREHAEEELAELVGWHSGSFRFEAGTAAASPEALDEPAAVADALERAAARRADLEAAAADLGPELRLAVPASPPGGADVTIEAGHWRLLAAAGPGATVAALVATSGLGELGTRGALRAMLDAGLLVEAGQAGAADPGEASLAEALDALDGAAGARADSEAGEGGDMVQRLVAGVRGL
jgi:hypothetical protein